MAMIAWVSTRAFAARRAHHCALLPAWQIATCVCEWKKEWKRRKQPRLYNIGITERWINAGRSVDRN
jgi:hypothetical protein